MLLIKVCVIILLSSVAAQQPWNGHFHPHPHPAPPAQCCDPIASLPARTVRLSAEQPKPGEAAALAPSKCRTDEQGTSLSVEIRLPFMDMELRHEQRQVHLMREPEQQLLFVLHGNELLQLFISRQDKRLINLGALEGRVRQLAPLGAAVVAWRQYLLLAVALEETVEIYQISQARLSQRIADVAASTGAPLNFEPIQELALPGKFKQLHLLKPSEQQVLLLLAANFTQQQGKYKTLEWLDSYFNPVEEFTVPAIQTLHVVGRQPMYVVSGRALRAQSKLVLTIYELETPALKLLRRQALTVKAQQVLAGSFRGRNYLIACAESKAAPCIYFRMVDGHFVVYRKHALRDLRFSQLAASEQGQLLAGARRSGEVLVFNGPRFDCYSGFATNDSDSSDLFIQRTAQNETFVVLGYRRASSTLVRIVELAGSAAATVGASLDSNDDLSAVQQHRHEFEETVNGLRSLLLHRKSLMDKLRQLEGGQGQRSLSSQSPLAVRGGLIELVQLEGQHLRSPTQLWARMEQLRQRYGAGRRTVRSFGVGNGNGNASQTVERLKVRRLQVDNLIYDGALLPGYHLEAGILTIKGKLLTKSLHSQQLLSPQNYDVNPDRVRRSAVERKTSVRHLRVQRINNMSWVDFHDSLFLRSRDSAVQGRLIMQADAKVDEMSTPLLNGHVVGQLFNLVRPQTVASNIFMSAFFASELEAIQVNGLNFSEDIAFRGRNETLIETPVRIYQLSVAGDILIANDTKWARVSDEASPAPLQQYYTGKVILNGSLTVNNLQRDTNATRLLINEQTLDRQQLQANYLLLHTPQNISTAVKFDNARVSAPAFSAAIINGQRTEEHWLSGGHQVNVVPSKPLYLIFMNASVEGDIICQNYKSKLAELSRRALRHGEVSNVTGVKRFEAPLTIEALWTRSLNGLPAEQLVQQSQLSAGVKNFSGLKSFEHIVVSQALQVEIALNASRLNRLPLEQLLSCDRQLERLELPDSTTLENLMFRRINGLVLDELFAQLSIGDDNRLLLHKDLLIEGNVRFEAPLQLQSINDIPDWSAYEARLVRADANAQLSGRKVFLSDVHVTDALHAPHLNQLDMSALLENTLLRATPQAISGAYSFGDLRASNLDVQTINGVPCSSFLDTRQRQVQLQGDLYVPRLTLHGSLKGELAAEPQLATLATRLASLRANGQWRNLVVLGDALWNVSAPGGAVDSRLAYLRRHGVTRSAEQRISGNVLLQQPLIGNMITRQPFPSELDFAHLAGDALLRNATGSQKVLASQTLLQGVVVNAAVIAEKGTHFELLNGIDVARFNASLYRLSSGAQLGGPLYFATAPIVGELIVDGRLNGLQTSGIYQLSEVGQGISVPVQLTQLRVEHDLIVGDINDGLSLDYLLQHRITLQGSALEVFGTLSFDQLVLAKQPLLRTINGIALDNVVYRHGGRLQAITGTKSFAGGVLLAGPAHVMHLNGKDLSESYQQSIFIDRNYNIDSLLLDQATFQAGLIAAKEANVVAQPRESAEEELILSQQLLDIELASNHTKPHRRRLLYLDYQEPLAAIWSAPLANETFDYELFYDAAPQSTLCERRFLRAQISRRLQRVYLANVTEQQLRVASSSSSIKVEAENYCRLLPRRLRSKIRVTCQREMRVLGMRRHLTHMELADVGNYSLILMNAVDRHSHRHDEVRVLRVDSANCSISDWQSLTLAVGGGLMRSLRLGNITWLLTSGLHRHQPALAIYQLEPQTQQFRLQQLIDGDYDLAELMELATPSGQEHQLVLSCRRCQRISVYVYSAQTQQFAPLQQLRLDARISALHRFKLGQRPFLLVLTARGSDHFYLFSYAHIEGWLPHTYGYLGQVQWAWPLLEAGSDAPLLLLCGEQQCNLVRALLA